MILAAHRALGIGLKRLTLNDSSKFGLNFMVWLLNGAQ
jgi:hypothetical protein